MATLNPPSDSSMLLSFLVFSGLLLILSPTYLVYVNTFSTGTAACNDSALDWYIKGVGETPCMTYERLRRICNNNFHVGTMNVSLPPDMCLEQVADCCCNNIAFNLSMLCLTCQQGLVNGIGFDAPSGTYQQYLTGTRTDGSVCSPNTNKTLTDSVQAGVCNQGIKMANDLYGVWENGAWYYISYSETATLNLNSQGDKAFHSCPVPTTSQSAGQMAPSSSPSSQTTAPPDQKSKGLIAGIAIAVTIVVAAIIAIIVRSVYYSRKRKHRFTFEISPLSPPPPPPNSVSDDEIRPMSHLRPLRPLPSVPVEVERRPPPSYAALINEKLNWHAEGSRERLLS